MGAFVTASVISMTCHLCAQSSVQMPEAARSVSMLDVAAFQLACNFCHDHLLKNAPLLYREPRSDSCTASAHQPLAVAVQALSSTQ